MVGAGKGFRHFLVPGGLICAMAGSLASAAGTCATDAAAGFFGGDSGDRRATLAAPVRPDDRFWAACGEVSWRAAVTGRLSLRISNGGEADVAGMSRDEVVGLLVRHLVIMESPNGIRIRPSERP